MQADFKMETSKFDATSQDVNTNELHVLASLAVARTTR